MQKMILKETYGEDNVKNGKRFINVGKVPKGAITYFGDGYHFLSNMYPCVVTYEDIEYPSTEHAYQAAKTLDKKLRLKISKMKSPNDAKAAGRSLNLREDWEEVKFQVMWGLLILKFTQPVFDEALLSTRDKHLIEGNWWFDTTWGVYNGEGQNALGKMLMLLRKQMFANNIKQRPKFNFK